MLKLRSIVRLYESGVGLKSIASMTGCSRVTVRKYVCRWHTLGLDYATFLGKSDAQLRELFCVSDRQAPPNARRQMLDSLMPEICKALSGKHQTSLKQWHKYIAEHPDGYGLTQFRLSIQRYRMISNPVMRMEHRAGEKLFVDFTGDKLWIYPPGEPARTVEVFVAVLGCSLLTYVEAVESQCKEDFIAVCERALYYYGGVPQAIVPDNLKSAVTKAHRYEPTINEEFARFAEHYGMVVDPARVRKPRDKAPVENAVKLSYRDIFTALDGLHCPDLSSLNVTIRAALERHNNKNLDRRNYSRREHFEDVERESLASLNPIRFQVKRHAIATVGKDGYVRLSEDTHHYSVPYTYIGQRVKLSYTTRDVEVYDLRTHELIATHARNRAKWRHTTQTEHLCPQHKAVLEWNPESFMAQGSAMHEDVAEYIRLILDNTRYHAQAHRMCSGILALARKVGVGRLSAACRLAQSIGRYSYKEVLAVLHENSDALSLIEEETPPMPLHENIRGAEYYQ
jgi:transposase